MTEPTPKPSASKPSRTIRRILAETFFVGLVGALVFGLAAELHLMEAGMIIAIIIWVVGMPALEILRVLQSRR